MTDIPREPGWQQDDPLLVPTFSVVCPQCNNRLRYVMSFHDYCAEDRGPDALSRRLSGIWLQHRVECRGQNG